MAVKLYVNNRVDGVVEVDPAEMAESFVASFDKGYDPPRRASLEFAYRWWISGPEGWSASWDEADWDTLADALAAYLSDKPAVKDRLWNAVCP